MSGSTAAILFAALVACSWPSPAFSFRVSSSVTPLKKVITLLEKLEAEIQADGSTEAASYDTFACFCKDKTKAVSDSITAGNDNIASLSATLKDKTAEKASKTTELADRKKKQETLAADLADTTARCSKEAADYAATEADLSKAIQSLIDAHTAIKNSKSSGSSGGSSSSGLLAVKKSVQKSMALAAALKIIDDGPQWGAVSAFLQESVDPLDPTYKFHSQPILTILTKLQDEFRQKKADLDAEYAKTKKTCDDTVTDLTGQMTTNKDAITQLGTDIDGLTSLLATTRGDLVQADSTLKDDQLYMKDLTALCEKRAGDWDQRTQLRDAELTAISQALDILKANVTSAEVVNQRAFVQVSSFNKAAVPAARTAAEGGSFSFLQGGLESEHRAGGAVQLKFGSRDAEAEATSQRQQELLGKAMSMLREESGSLRSETLSVLVARTAADPFGKVKTLIQRLIERLLQEATAEATKKGFCDTSLGKSLQDRTFRYEEAMKLNSELRSLEAKKEQLEIEMQDLTTSKQALEIALTDATTNRADDKTNNLADIKTAKEGLHAVTEAIMILKTFYKDAAKATVLAQKASPVDEDTSGPGFEGAYRGKQQGSKGIIGLLEVIKSDFSRTVRKTTKAEQDASAAFVLFDRSSKADISGKDMKLTLDGEDLKTTDSKISTKMQDMQSNMDLVDVAIKEVEALKPMCIDTGMSYAERVAKRDKEVEALRKAFCILDDQGVEQALCSQWGY